MRAGRADGRSEVPGATQEAYLRGRQRSRSESRFHLLAKVASPPWNVLINATHSSCQMSPKREGCQAFSFCRKSPVTAWFSSSFLGTVMAVSTHIPNSTVPDCRMCVPRHNTHTHHKINALSPMPSCLGIGGPLVGPGIGKAVGGSTAHTSTRHQSTQQTRMSPRQTHEVTNTDSVIRAH